MKLLVFATLLEAGVAVQKRTGSTLADSEGDHEQSDSGAYAQWYETIDRSKRGVYPISDLDGINAIDVELFEALGWDQLNEESWFKLDCNDMMRINGGWKDKYLQYGGVCFTYDTRTYTKTIFAPTDPHKRAQVLTKHSARGDCETQIWHQMGTQVQTPYGKSYNVPGPPKEKKTSENSDSRNYAMYKKWCPAPSHRMNADVCGQIPIVESVWNNNLGWCWNDDDGKDAWHWSPAFKDTACTQDRYYGVQMTGGFYVNKAQNDYLPNRHVFCPAPQCMSNAQQSGYWNGGWHYDSKTKADCDKGFPTDMPKWMCGQELVWDGTDGLTAAGKYKGWKIPFEEKKASLHNQQLYACPVERQVPYTPPTEDMKQSWPRYTSTAMRVFNRTYYQSRCFDHENEQCSPSATPKSRLEWTAVEWDDLDCDSFLVGRRKLNDYEAVHYGGLCVQKQLRIWPNPDGLGVVSVGGNHQRNACDFGWETNVQAKPGSNYARYGSEHRRKWCPVCHWANDGTVCEKVPQLIPYQSGYNWCWSNHKKPTAKSDELEEWRWRVLSWSDCTGTPAMLRGWVACPAPTCKDDFRKREVEFACTSEYLAMGICDVVGPSGKYTHKSLLKENYGKYYGSRVYTCNPGEWVPVTRPLECPSKKYGFYWNGTWTVTTTTTTLPACDEYADENSCPARCTWLAGECKEDPCASFNKDQCPPERCRVKGEECGNRACSEFSDQNTCPSHCFWDKDLGCQNSPCEEYIVEKSCPEDTCKWNSGSSKCEAIDCSEFPDEKSCPKTRCKFTEEDGCTNADCKDWKSLHRCWPNRCAWKDDACQDTTTTTTKEPVMFKPCPVTGEEGSNECPPGCTYVDDCGQCELAAKEWKDEFNAKYSSQPWPASRRPEGCFRNRKWKLKCNPHLPGSFYENNEPKVGGYKGKWLICQVIQNNTSPSPCQR